MRIERKIETREISKPEKDRDGGIQKEKSQTEETLKIETERTYTQVPPPASHTENCREMLAAGIRRSEHFFFIVINCGSDTKRPTKGR